MVELVFPWISTTIHFPVLIGPHAWFVIPLSLQKTLNMLLETPLKC